LQSHRKRVKNSGKDPTPFIIVALVLNSPVVAVVLEEVVNHLR
jgi:hypothetical protein